MISQTDRDNQPDRQIYGLSVSYISEEHVHIAS